MKEMNGIGFSVIPEKYIFLGKMVWTIRQMSAESWKIAVFEFP
jgi:hypothetical protein